MPTETALITGTSSGIGEELARLFAQDRSNLVFVARSREKLERLAAQLRAEHGIEVEVLAGDLADGATPQAIFDELAAKGIAVDVLVNNAGFGARGSINDLLKNKLGAFAVCCASKHCEEVGKAIAGIVP